MSGILYGLKMLFRKSGTASAMLSIALLVAITASMNSVVNYLGFQTQSLSKLAPPGETYIILSQNSTAITDSTISPELATQLNNTGHLNYVLPQKLLTVNLTTQNQKATVQIRGANDIRAYLRLRNAYLNGTAAEKSTEANVGEVLANILSIKVEDEVELTLGKAKLEVKVTGIFRSQTQSDTEILVSMEKANELDGNSAVSLIEFTLIEDARTPETLTQITKLLPENIRLVQAQQLKELAQQMSTQTLAFLNIWSLAVYAVVAAASYIIATRLTTESSYEFTILKALGAKRASLFTFILTYIVTIALLGSMLGIALGTAGAQTASTLINWIRSSVQITPFIETEQAIRIFLLALASSVLGCLCPAVKFARTEFMEQPL